MSAAMEEPLLSSSDTATAPPSSATVLSRLAAAVAIVAVSLWANYEASKGADIAIVRPLPSSRAARRFDLHFVSNGRAHREIYRASRFVERALYPDDRFPRKPVSRITLQLAATTDLPSAASVAAGGGYYMVHLSEAVMAAADTDAAVSAAVSRAVARVWLWDGEREAPEPMLEALEDYLATQAGFPNRISNSTCHVSGGSLCWSSEFVQHCEARRRGFLARLNWGMRRRWADSAADQALGSSVRRAYAAYTAAKNTTWDVAGAGRGTGHVMQKVGKVEQ